MKLLKTIGAVFFFFSCNAQSGQAKLTVNKDENSLLWQVSGKDLTAPTYLFGTFHLMCKDDIHFSEQLKKALANSALVYMEMDMDDPSIMLNGLLMMNMKNGKKLQDLYSPADYEKVSAYFKDTLHLPIGLLQTTKPFFLSAMLYPKMMPCKTISGVEEELLKLARQEKKEIKGFETMEFQASVFDSIPYEEQAKDLLMTIDNISSYKKYFDIITTVYNTQRLDNIEKQLKDTAFGMEAHQDILLNDRNKNWVAQLKKIMPLHPVFVAVGTGHLVGGEGLISLLRKEGYTLKPIYNR